MDRHSETVADKIYAALTPKENAKLSEYAFNQIMGKPVEFPTNSQWEVDGVSIEEILNRATEIARAGDAEEVEEDFADLLELEDASEDASEDWTAILPAMKDDNKLTTVDPEASVAGLSEGGGDDGGVDPGAEQGEEGAEACAVADKAEGKDKQARGNKIGKPSKKKAKARRRKETQKEKNKLEEEKSVFSPFDDQTTDSSGPAQGEDPKRTKVEPPTIGKHTCESKQHQSRSMSAASGGVRHTTRANVKRMFSPRRHVQPLAQSDLDAIERLGRKSRGAGFNEAEKVFFIEEMRECEKQGGNPLQMREVKKLVEVGRKHDFLMPIVSVGSETEEQYLAKVQRFLRDLKKINPFPIEAEAS